MVNLRGMKSMNNYKVTLFLTEKYELIVEAENADQAYDIANDMDIVEFTETGITTQDMLVSAV